MLHHVSSIAAAGHYKGLFREDMFDEGQKLPIAYHRTKFESEKIVRDARAGRRGASTGPAIVVGHSQTGEMDKIDGPYYFFKAIQKAAPPLPAVGAARRPGGRLHEHRPGRLRRRRDGPHRATSPASTARRSTSSTRRRSAPAT